MHLKLLVLTLMAAASIAAPVPNEEKSDATTHIRDNFLGGLPGPGYALDETKQIKQVEQANGGWIVMEPQSPEGDRRYEALYKGRIIGVKPNWGQTRRQVQEGGRVQPIGAEPWPMQFADDLKTEIKSRFKLYSTGRNPRRSPRPNFFRFGRGRRP